MANRIASLIVDLSANVSEFRTSMSNAAESVSSLTSTVTRAKEAILGFLASREIVGFLKESTAATLEWTFAAEDLHKITGLNLQQSGALNLILREQGVSLETGAQLFAKVGLAVSTHAKALAQYGIATRDSTGSLLSENQILQNVFEKVETLRSGTDRLVFAQAAFGRGGAALLPVLQELGEAGAFLASTWGKDTDFLRALGLEVDSSGVAKAKEWRAAEADLRVEFIAVENQIGKALLPQIKSLADFIREHVANGDLQNWAKDASIAILDLVETFEKLAHALVVHRQAIAATLEVSGVGLAAAGIASGNPLAVVAGIAGAEAGAGLARTIPAETAAGDAAFRSRIAALEKKKAELSVQHDALWHMMNNSTVVGGDDAFAPGGGKAGSGRARADDSIKAAAAYEKESAAITANVASLRAQTAEWQRGGAGIQELIDRQHALEAAMKLPKGASDAQRESLARLDLEQSHAKEVTDTAKKATEDHARAAKDAAESYRRFTGDLQTHIRFEQGYAVAVRGTKDQLKSFEQAQRDEVELARVSVGWTQQQIDEARQKMAIDAQATAAAEQVKETTDKLREAGREVGDVLGSAFTDLIKPGNDLEQTFMSITQAIEQMIIKLLIMKPLEDALSQWMSSSGGLLGILGSLFGGGGGGGASIGGGAGIFDPGGGTLFPPFANGGSFDVGGMGGTDSQTVAFRATPGEHVQVGGKGGGGGSQIVNIHNHSGEPAQVQRQKNSQGTETITVTIGKAIAHNIRSGGDVALAMRDVHGDRRQPIQR